LFTARLCRALGIDVGHERVREHGAVGWMYAGNQAHMKRATVRLHQVRHPLAVIRSTTWMRERARQRISRVVGVEIPAEPSVLRGAMHWLHWNRLAEQQCEWTYQVEQLRAGTPTASEWCERIGVRVPEVWPRVSTTTNRKHGALARRADPVQWHELDPWPDVKCGIMDLARTYGYSIPEGESSEAHDAPNSPEGGVQCP
jgi:hypothetical protein